MVTFARKPSRGRKRPSYIIQMLLLVALMLHVHAFFLITRGTHIKQAWLGGGRVIAVLATEEAGESDEVREESLNAIQEAVTAYLRQDNHVHKNSNTAIVTSRNDDSILVECTREIDGVVYGIDCQTLTEAREEKERALRRDAAKRELDTVREGTPVRCVEETNGAVYHYTGGYIRKYPNKEIASSWVADWTSVSKTIDCSNVPRGPDMTLNNEEAVPFIKCTGESDGSIYWYHAGTIRLYPNPSIASSWFADWSAAIKLIDCANVPRGPAMTLKQTR